MNWKNCDSILEIEQTAETKESIENLKFQSNHIENERRNLCQLKKYQDPAKDEQRHTYISIASRLGDSLVNLNKETDIETLITDDFEAFLFNFAEITPVQYANNLNDFINLYKDAQVIKRTVTEVNVDVDNAIAFQICYCEILDPKENKIIPQFSFEVFSFKDNKICKYRASFGCSGSFNEHQHPFIPSRKDQMLAKVKELNYAWANHPDLDKIASLLDDATEYKIWRWQDQEPFTFYKRDFVQSFKNLEEKYALKLVIPYEVYSEGQYILSNYVFHLEGRHNELMGKKFMWVSACIYKFDQDINIAKISQHGEFYPEDEVVIPFKPIPRESIEKRLRETSKHVPTRSDLSTLDTTDMNFSFEATRFGPSQFWNIDYVRGFNEFEKLTKIIKDETRNFEWERYVDLYVDFQDPSYSIAIAMGCLKGSITKEAYKYSGLDMNFYIARKFYLENGKLSKVTTFHSEIPEPIPSHLFYLKYSWQ